MIVKKCAFVVVVAEINESICAVCKLQFIKSVQFKASTGYRMNASAITRKKLGQV